MKLLSISKKRASLALFFFLSSCSNPCPSWKFAKIETSCSRFNSGKIFISPENPGTGLELEIARMSSISCQTPEHDLRLYINIFSIEPFPFSKGKIPMTVVIDDHEYEILADRFEGGQRFLLPVEIYTPILDALLSDTIVTIILGRYKSDIIGLNFTPTYENLRKI